MTNFKTTFIAGFIFTMGAAASAQAADDTFTVVLKQDTTVSVEENYKSLQTQARAACKQEARRAGFRKSESTTWLRRKCEKDILAKVIETSNDPYLSLVHDEASGKKVKTKAYAQK